jgi:hypothetical protein
MRLPQFDRQHWFGGKKDGPTTRPEGRSNVLHTYPTYNGSLTNRQSSFLFSYNW